MPTSKHIRVHSYESMGTFDGPGLRYVVFTQGCPFRCLYCANPDTIDAVGDSKLTDPDYILEQAISMKPFFGKRGGITFSGGEPTVQAEALIPLFRRLKEAGIHTCLDSNGTVWNEHVEELFGLCDLVLLDVKEFNDERHRHITGRSNEQTLRTIMRQICARWASISATTSRYSAWNSCPTTASAYTNTRPWASPISCPTRARTRPSSWRAPKASCANTSPSWWSTRARRHFPYLL